MTVSQRRIRTDPGKPEGAATEPGIKYTCDCCGVDITHTVRIKCAAKECEEVDLCPMCFSEGKETQKHKAWHDYKVIEQHSQPIFSEDWGADEELLLVSGLILHGLGNWLEVASHIGTRTKEECEKHYKECYLGVSVDDLKSAVNGDHKEESVQGDLDIDADRPVKKQKRDFMPHMDMTFDIDPDEFQQRKKARIEEMRKPHALPAGSSNPLVSAPTNHEVAGFMPGRLEFEHEVDNEAEMVVKDFDFGLVWKYGGDEQPQAKVTKASGDDDVEEEEEEDGEGRANEAQKNGKVSDPDIEPGVKVDPQEIKVKQEPKDLPQPEASSSQSPIRKEAGSQSPSKKGKEKEVVEPEQEVEDDAELEVKLALLDIYFSKLDKREEAKDLIFDRGLTEYKRIQANERKRPKEERELIHRYKVFAKLQTAQDFEVLVEGLVYEQNLRKRILELQEYRRMGITTGAEAEAYDTAKAARAGYRPIPARNELLPTGARVNQGQHRHLYGPGTPPPGMPKGDSREPTPRVVSARKPPTPLNLANSAALDLLSLEEQSLCSSLRVLPKPYLSIKETFVRENERRRGLLKRRDARRMLKIDVNKSGRIFDFLVSAGMLVLAYDPTVKSVYPSLPVNGKENGHGPVVEVYPGGQRDERMEGVNGTTEVSHR